MAKVNMVGPAGTLKVEEKDVRSYQGRGYVVTDKPKEEEKVADKSVEKPDDARTKTKKRSKPKPSDDNDNDK